MKRRGSQRTTYSQWLTALAVFTLSGLSAVNLRADLVRMVNGDQYFGNVTSVDSKTVVLQSQFLGTLRLPRSSVAALGFGLNAASNLVSSIPMTNSPVVANTTSLTNSLPHYGPGLAQLGAQTNIINQVRRQFLADAGPEANAKFDELLNGLMSGQLSITDLRSQAQTAADQLRAAKKDMGPEAGGLLDTYLEILDHFLKDTSSDAATTTTPSAKAKPSASSTNEE